MRRTSKFITSSGIRLMEEEESLLFEDICVEIVIRCARVCVCVCQMRVVSVCQKKNDNFFKDIYL